MKNLFIFLTVIFLGLNVKGQGGVLYVSKRSTFLGYSPILNKTLINFTTMKGSCVVALCYDSFTTAVPKLPIPIPIDSFSFQLTSINALTNERYSDDVFFLNQKLKYTNRKTFDGIFYKNRGDIISLLIDGNYQKDFILYYTTY